MKNVLKELIKKLDEKAGKCNSNTESGFTQAVIYEELSTMLKEIVTEEHKNEST